MFERYTEKARRVIFFARYEALQYGSQIIAPEHVLLGLMREDKSVSARFFPFRNSLTVEAVRREVEEENSFARPHFRNRRNFSLLPKPKKSWRSPAKKARS